MIAKGVIARYILALVSWGALLLLLPASAKAQTLTTVTGTITDPNGLPYSGARVSATLVPGGSGTPTYTPCHNPQAGCQIVPSGPVTASVSGAFTMNLWATGSILPAGSTYTFNVQETGVLPPFGTGAQVCSISGVTFTGATIDLSAQLSAACPALTNQAYQPPPGPYPGPIFNLLLYGGKGDGRLCNVSTNSTTTITAAGANPCAFVTADPGRIAWVMNPSTNALICGSLSTPETIVSQTGTAAVLAHACTATLASTALAYIGTDNWTPMQTMATAMTNANGGQAYVPKGFYMVGGPGTGSTIAFSIPSSVTSALIFSGAGRGGTVFYPAPWIRTSSALNGGLLDFANDEAAVLSDFTVDLYELNKSPLSNSVIGAQYPQFERVSVRNNNWQGIAAYGMVPNVAENVPAYISDSYACAQNDASINLSSMAAVPFTVDFRNDTLCAGSSGAIQFGSTGATVNIVDGLYTASTATTGAGIIYIGSGYTGSVLNIRGTVFCSAGNDVTDIYNAEADMVNVDSIQTDTASCPSAAGPAVTNIQNAASGAVVNVRNSQLNATGAGTNFNLVSGSSALDFGGNTAAGGAGILTGSGALFGSASICNSTQLAANITPSTGWGTAGTGGAGVSAVSGTSCAEYFTITAAGTPTANPTIAIVFPTPFWQAPHCTGGGQIGGTGVFSDVIQSTLPTATGLTLTWEGTPTAGKTYIFSVPCQ